MSRIFDRIEEWFSPWGIWADLHGIPEMFWGPQEFWYYVGSPRRLRWEIQSWGGYWFGPQQEPIDYIDGYCVGYYNIPSRFMWGVYAIQSWVDPRYWWWRATGMLPWPMFVYRLKRLLNTRRRSRA